MPENKISASITVCGPLLESEEEFSQMVSKMLIERLDCETFIKPFAEITVNDDPYCIFIDSPRHPILETFRQTFSSF